MVFTTPPREERLYPGRFLTCLCFSSQVIEHLTRERGSVDNPITFFYCDFKEKWDATTVLGALLWQILAGLQDLDPKLALILKKFEAQGRLAAPLDFPIVEELFTATLAQFWKTFLIVDALDECKEDEKERLLAFFSRQLALQGQRGCLKIFITSRYKSDGDRFAQNMPNSSYLVDINNRDTEGDIESFVTREIDRAIQLGEVLASSDLREEIIQTLVLAADGMYVIPSKLDQAFYLKLSNPSHRLPWAQLQISQLKLQTSELGIRSQLRELSHVHTLNYIYSRAWKNIQDSKDTVRELAHKTLAWILFSITPLHPRAILEAISINELATQPDLSNDRMVCSIDTLIESCCNLVTLDQDRQVLLLVHYSTIEFLQKQPEFASAHNLLSGVCLAILGNTGSELSDDGIYLYAALNWEKHVESWDNIDAKRANLLQSFLHNPTAVSRWVSFRKARDASFNTGFIPVSKPTAFDAATYFDFPIILQHLLDQNAGDNPESRSNLSHSLILGAACGSSKVLDLLINCGADVNAQGGQFGNALQAAARGGHGEIVKLLLDRGADVNAQGGLFGSALQAAVQRGYKSIMQLLLERGAHSDAINTADNFALPLSRRSSGLRRAYKEWDSDDSELNEPSQEDSWSGDGGAGGNLAVDNPAKPASSDSFAPSDTDQSTTEATALDKGKGVDRNPPVDAVKEVPIVEAPPPTPTQEELVAEVTATAEEAVPRPQLKSRVTSVMAWRKKR